MNKKNFSELMDSLSEGREILGGARLASRTWTVKDGQRIQSKEDIQSVRHEFGVSQVAFAKFMGVSVNTLQNLGAGTPPADGRGACPPDDCASPAVALP